MDSFHIQLRSDPNGQIIAAAVVSKWCYCYVSIWFFSQLQVLRCQLIEFRFLYGAKPLQPVHKLGLVFGSSFLLCPCTRGIHQVLCLGCIPTSIALGWLDPMCKQKAPSIPRGSFQYPKYLPTSYSIFSFSILSSISLFLNNTVLEYSSWSSVVPKHFGTGFHFLKWLLRPT